MYKFNRSAAPFRIIFSRAYVFTVCSPLLALVRCNLPRSRSVRIQHLSRLPSTVGRKSRSEVRACAYFVAGFHVRRTGLKRSLRCLAANVCCVQKSLKGSSLHTLSLTSCRKTFGEDRGKEPFGTFSLVYRQFVFILTSIQQPSVGRLVR